MLKNDLQILKDLVRVTELGNEFLYSAQDDINWHDDGQPIWTVLLADWGSIFVDGYSSRTAQLNTEILQIIDSALENAWKNSDQNMADGIDFFAEQLEDAIQDGRLPQRDILLKDTGIYISNVIR